jgi:hypothetical protein
MVSGGDERPVEEKTSGTAQGAYFLGRDSEVRRDPLPAGSGAAKGTWSVRRVYRKVRKVT